MSKRLKLLEDRKAAIVQRMTERSDKAAETGEVELSAENKAAHDADKAAVGRLNAEIKDEKEIVEIQRGLSVVPDANVEAEAERKKRGGQKTAALAYDRMQAPTHFKGDRAQENAYRAGQWYLAAIWGDEEALAYCEANGVLSMTAMIDGKGGILVPEEIGNVINNLKIAYGIIRREARREPMGSEGKTIPTSSNLVDVFFVNDQQETPESDVSFGGIKLVAKELAALVKWPKTLDEDSVIDLADRLTEIIAYSMAKREDECGFIGDGTSKYGGIVGICTILTDGKHTASVVEAATGNQKFADLDWADFEAVVGKLPEYAEANAKWYISKPGWAASMQRLSNAAGGNTSENVANGVGRVFQGYPVVNVPSMNRVLTNQTSKLVALLGDLKQGLVFGDRRQIVIEVDGSAFFKQRMWAIQGTERFDIAGDELGDNTEPGSVIALVTAAT